jgi:hypothetical protein
MGMRWFLALVAIAVSFGACTLGPGASSGSGGAGGGDAGSTCAQEVCTTCLMCAANGPCDTLNDACNADSDCVAIEQCLSFGTDLATCEGNTPDGVTDYQNLAQCGYCTECPTICAGLYPCAG